MFKTKTNWRENYSNEYVHEEEVSSDPTRDTVAENMAKKISNISPDSDGQKSPENDSISPTGRQSADSDSEPGKGNTYLGPELLDDCRMRFLDSNGVYQTRTGILPMAGRPPVSDSEGEEEAAESSPPKSYVVKTILPVSKRTTPITKPRSPDFKISTPSKTRPTVRPCQRLGSISFKIISATKAAMAVQAARHAAASARIAKKAANLNKKIDEKTRKKERKQRKQAFLLGLLAFQDELNKAEAELARLIAEGNANIARIRERRRIRKERREERRKERRVIKRLNWKTPTVVYSPT